MAFQLWKNLNYNNPLPIYYRIQCRSYDMKSLYDTYGPINTTNISNRMQYTMYPEISNYTKCAAMLLNNLVNPEWITINCDEPIRSDIMCHFPRKIKPQFNMTAEKKYMYNTACVHINRTCFIFHWGEINNNDKKKISMIPINHISIFKDLFDAISVSFPPIMLNGMRYTMTYKRYSNLYIYKKIKLTNTLTKALLVYTKTHFSFIKGSNVFNCGSHVISITDLCNGKMDCQNDEKLDEMQCDCEETQVYSSNCKHLTSVKGQKHCSDFYIKVKNNECWPISTISCMTGTKEKGKIDFCYWLKNKSSRSKVSWDPKTNIFSANFKDKSFANCMSQGLLSCMDEQNNCYNISEICTYILDERKDLLYCEGGEHLQYCKEFECNMKFKCPSIYCIPWAYVCDGKFDCPNGLEEQICKVGIHCKNMFKYKNSQICIHLNDICDAKFDCPYNEDELACILHGTLCPTNCECLMFTIRCFNLATVDLFLKIENSFDAIIISNSTKGIINSFLQYSRFLSILKLPKNSLDELCQILPPLNKSLLIDVGFNEISRLKSQCFVQAVYLKIIKLNNNQISTFDKGAFIGLNKLFVLDLSCNLLTVFSTFTYITISNLHLLKLNQNNIKFVIYKLFHQLNIDFIESNVHSLTCIQNLKRKLLSKIPWFLSCGNFLLNNRILIYSVCIFITIFIFNVISIIQNGYFQRAKSVFTVNALSLNVIDTLHCLYILYLFSVNLHYGENFGFHQIQWRSSHVCFVGFAIALNLTLLPPILSCFVALGRLMIVCFPVDTKFRTKQFIIKCIFTFTIITIFYGSKYYNCNAEYL